MLDGLKVGPALVLAAALLLGLVMAVVWIVAVRIRNAGIVDVAWSANFTLLAVLRRTRTGASSGSSSCRRGWTWSSPPRSSSPA